MSMSIKERFNNLLKKNDQEPTIFDQNSFDLKVFGGPTQADLIKLECALLDPEKFAGKNLVLNCKWFNKTQKDLVEITGTAGQSHYQPSLKDVGTTQELYQPSIRVECFPSIQGKTYQGMPIHRDIGPLTLEKETQQDAQQFVDSGSATLLVKIVRSSQSTHYSQMDGLVKVTTNQITVKVKQTEEFTPLFSVAIDQHFPNYMCDAKNHKLLKIDFSEKEFVEVLVQQSRMRDVLVLASKMLAGKKIISQAEKDEDTLESQPTQCQLPSPTKKTQQGQSYKIKVSARDLMQVAQLTRQCTELKSQNQNLRIQSSQSKSKQIQAETKVKTTEERLENLNKNYFNIEQELQQLKNKNSTDVDKFLFVNNEIRALKDQNQALKREVTSTKVKLGETRDQLSKHQLEEGKPTYEALWQMYTRFESESQVLSKRLGFSQEQKVKFKDQAQQQRHKNQELVYSLGRLNSRYESLVKESTLPKGDHIPTGGRFQINQEQEIMKLKSQIKGLVEENNDLRKRGSLKSPEKTESKNPKKVQLKELQKLANSLAQAITEKDQIIEDMRQINKQLASKVTAQEQKQKQQSL